MKVEEEVKPRNIGDEVVIELMNSELGDDLIPEEERCLINFGSSGGKVNLFENNPQLKDKLLEAEKKMSDFYLRVGSKVLEIKNKVTNSDWREELLDRLGVSEEDRVLLMSFGVWGLIPAELEIDKGLDPEKKKVYLKMMLGVGAVLMMSSAAFLIFRKRGKSKNKMEDGYDFVEDKPSWSEGDDWIDSLGRESEKKQKRSRKADGTKKFFKKAGSIASFPARWPFEYYKKLDKAEKRKFWVRAGASMAIGVIVMGSGKVIKDGATQIQKDFSEGGVGEVFGGLRDEVLDVFKKESIVDQSEVEAASQSVEGFWENEGGELGENWRVEEEKVGNFSGDWLESFLGVENRHFDMDDLKTPQARWLWTRYSEVFTADTADYWENEMKVEVPEELLSGDRDETYGQKVMDYLDLVLLNKEEAEQKSGEEVDWGIKEGEVEIIKDMISGRVPERIWLASIREASARAKTDYSLDLLSYYEEVRDEYIKKMEDGGVDWQSQSGFIGTEEEYKKGDLKRGLAKVSYKSRAVGKSGGVSKGQLIGSRRSQVKTPVRGSKPGRF